MKESYFTDGTIDGTAREMLEYAGRLAGRRDFVFEPQRSALLIIDMQRYFLERRSHAFIPSAVAVLPRVRRLAEAFAARGLPVVCTRHLDSREPSSMMYRWWGDPILEEDELSEVVPELVMPHAVMLPKTQYDAFHLTALEPILRGFGSTQVVVTGVMTHLCCETTARSAFVRGMTVFFTVDGTATNSEDFHRAALLNLAHGFAVPVLVGELLALLGGA